MLGIPKITRFMRAGEEEIIKGWRRLDKEVDEFVFLWSRWKRWGTQPPIMALHGSRPVGYHGVSWGKGGVVNSMSQFVLPENRGIGLAGMMVEFLLGEAYARKMTRLRFRTPASGPGLEMWRGLGAEPFGERGGDLWFDLSIEGMLSVDDLLKNGPSLSRTPTTNKRTLGYYRRSDVTPILEEWKEVL